MKNYTRRIDVAFNYGMFSFNTPNFIFRFVAGETDYQLGITPYSILKQNMQMRGSSVYQQVLNLTQSEKGTFANDSGKIIIYLRIVYTVITISMIIVLLVHVTR